MEVNARDDLDDDDRRGDPVDPRGRTGATTGVGDELPTVLPQILEAVARQAECLRMWASSCSRRRG
jgi:hypothetical protein